jgi:hypothetical protein
MLPDAGSGPDVQTEHRRCGRSVSVEDAADSPGWVHFGTLLSPE